ncbi:MAG: glycosyltransferase family 4 protein [Actinobacteria bacterium]|nr:glycosyltransferase family 4 protein [Actinomycetota bacterium]
MKVAIVMPPATGFMPAAAVARWSTVTAAAEALHRDGRADPEVHCRHVSESAVVERNGVEYRFHSSDRALAASIGSARPDVVHVHGLGWARLIRRLHTGVRGVPLVAQHHGELPFTGRARAGHRMIRRHIDGYLFTGASTGQVQPWVDGGVISPTARWFEVLEAGSLLPSVPAPSVQLEGDPAVLWVGRLNEGKDPLTAVDAFALAASTLPQAHLHLLASDRTLEREVRARIDALGVVGGRVHLHDAVPHEQIAAWYAASHLFVSTSRHEGSGYSLIEALTCGCVPVVTSIPPHRAIVGELGGQFAPGDARGAAVSLATCSTMPREPIATAARTIVSWGRVAEQLVGAYTSVVQRT